MSVNTSIYGTPEEWSVANLGVTQNHADRKDSFLTAHFGGGGNTLENGYGYGINLNTPIDKSISYCGLGSFSSWSKIEYYKRNRELELIGKDNRSVTNFSFNQAVKVATMTGIWYSENTSWSSSRYGSRCRFAPNAINSSSQENYNNGFIPIVQIPIKNCVLVPIFRAAKQINTDGTTTGMDVATVTCWDYYSTTATRNHNTHPYILGIGFLFYTKTTDSATQRSGVSSSLSAILDELALYKNVPVDLQRPDQNVLSGGYSYCWNVPQSSFSYKHIFGYVNNGAGSVSNAIDYRVNDLPSSTRTDLLKAVAVFPHERAVFSDEWAVNTTTYARYYYLQYYDNGPEDNLREWVRKQLACFGLFFTDVSAAVAQSGAFDSDDMFLGILDDNNIGQGVYTSGEDNRNQKQWEWETTNDSDYDPSGGGGDTDPNTYSQTSGFNSVLNAPEGFNKRYVLSASDVRQLNTDFFKALQSKPDDVDYINFSMSEFLTNDPINAIVSLKWFPFTVPSYGASTPIKLGNYQTTVSAPYYTGSGVEVYNLGSFKLFPYFGNSFLDYEPYSKTSVVIPYCGTVQIDHSIYMGTTVSIHLIVDIYTGACTAQIKSDGLVVDSVSGVCSVDLPISGIDNATLEGQIYNASLNLKSSKISEGTTVVSGGLSVGSSALGFLSGSQAKRFKSGLETASALTSAIEGVNQSTKNLSQSKYDISHVQIPFKSVGAQTGLSNAKFEQFCRVLLYRPIFLNGAQDVATWYDTAEAKSYAKTVGYATVKSGNLGSFTGFTVCSNADLSGIPATDTEKEQILNLLKSGVYM